MALTSWKAFRFFDVTPINDADQSILEKGSVSCITASSDHVYVGSPDGTIRILNQSFKTTQSWKAHESGALTNIRQIPHSSLLVTLAEDLPHEPVLKVWALDRPDKKTGTPRCLTSVSVTNGRKPFPVSAFAVLRDLSQVAVGFANGAVTVIRGDFIHDRGTKQRTVLETDEPITGLEFREANVTTLFISTTSRISTLIISGKGQGQPARTLDEHGCAVGCLTKDLHSNDIIVARDDAVYAYNPRGRVASYAYEGPKKLTAMYKDYVLLVSPPKTMTNAPTRSFGGGQADDLFSTSNFTILNPDLKLIAHTEALPSQVNALFAAWGHVYIVTLDGKVLRYTEKTFQQKLEVLYQREFFVLAINLAQKEKVDAVQQNLIFRKYGDYLYRKGDFDTAMQQYLRAIDNTEPSQIIRKFLDNQRIRNLIEYLEELHEHHRASSDHTTLLLNCYAKLKDVEKLEDFIKSPGDLKFDLDTAITMCRQGGYSDQAAFLARKHNEHGLVVDILIEDLKRYAEALAYIWRLEPEQAYDSLTKYGTVLLEHCPEDTKQLFIDYFTGNFRPKKDAVVEQEITPEQEQSGGIGKMATSAVQNLAALIPLPYMSAEVPRTPGGTKTTQQVIETTVEDEYVEYKVPKPRAAFSSFVDHPDEFISFLEACIASSGLKDEDKTDLYTTLFEMYLQIASKKTGDEKSEWESKARHLVEEQNTRMGTSNILLLSHLSNFRDGTTLVREQRGLYFDIFRSYTAANDTTGAIKALRKYGPEEPQLYPAALAYFTSTEEILAEASSELDSVLKKIDDDGLMAPLQVIQILSQSKVATMGLVKTYLSRTIERERAEIASNRKLISSYRTDTAAKANELETLATKPVSFSATRCCACGAPLDLPTVHFLCKHSFHERCLYVGAGDEESDVECPKCANDNATVKAIKRAQDESADRHELFLDALGRSRDKFATVSEWFGRGVMGRGAVSGLE
ncbi:vacuolar protein sorting protein-like protein [Aureobasidium sp. EXF-12298]|nr:vacuolar protein sorting protein-like protein [Aureobasidium sp. EXF-12298]KAI4766539.1 vacuolar protein sorting protein-like protein [Aureobasidium sp. EXF-12344]KAI4784181.1 vacuolar protein sorting protein-like protein [Aureobasidium sp. EXF-3400]